MNETVNLHLPQFEETDRIHHDDFNDAFSKIDAAVPIIGTYVGTGTGKTQTITLGFQPHAVFVMPGNCGVIDYCAGIATPENPYPNDGSALVTVNDTGFSVTSNANHTNYGTYRYIAF